MVDAYGELDVPKNQVTVLVVDQSGDTAVRVQVGVLGRLLLVLAKIEVDRLVGKSKFLQKERYFPGSEVT